MLVWAPTPLEHDFLNVWPALAPTGFEPKTPSAECGQQDWILTTLVVLSGTGFLHTYQRLQLLAIWHIL